MNNKKFLGVKKISSFMLAKVEIGELWDILLICDLKCDQFNFSWVKHMNYMIGLPEGQQDFKNLF